MEMNLSNAPVALRYFCLHKHPVVAFLLQVTGQDRHIILSPQDKFTAYIRCSCGVGLLLIPILNLPISTIFCRIKFELRACHTLQDVFLRIILIHLFDLTLQDGHQVELEAHVGIRISSLQIKEVQGVEGVIRKGVAFSIFPCLICLFKSLF